MDTKQSTQVDCRECHFSTVVAAGTDRNPADVVIAHGRESGHKLSVTTFEE